MSSDLTISAIASFHAGSGGTAGPREADSASLHSSPAATASSPYPNPTLQLDPELGLVVIEFRNGAGAVTTSIPSQRQIEAYQRWQTTHFGPPPEGSAPSDTEASAEATSPPAQQPAKGALNRSFNQTGKTGGRS